MLSSRDRWESMSRCRLYWCEWEVGRTGVGHETVLPSPPETWMGLIRKNILRRGGRAQALTELSNMPTNY